MKRSIVAVIAAVCLFAGGNAFALTVEEEIALLKEDIAKMKEADKGGSLSDALGVSIEASGTIIMQGVTKTNTVVGEDDGRHDATYSIDLGIGKEFSNGGTAFMHLEAGDGDGVDGSAYSYGGINGDAGNSENSVEVTEFWYEQPLFDNKFVVTFGKLNPTGYFDENEYANDENTQFVAPAFVNNATIGFTDNNLGLRVTYSPIEMIDITYSYMTYGWDNIDSDGFNAIQVNVKPFEGSNYRVMYWSSNDEATEFDSVDDRKGTYGIAASLDQKITDTVGVFGRFGYADPSVSEYKMTWSVGAQFGGSMWTRDNDTVGIAVGQIMPSGDWTDAELIKDDSETQAELYYSFAIGDNFFITPSVQYLNKPLGGNAANDDDIFVYGIRTHIAF